MPREPGRVDFTTAGNAQLSQTQSGSTVDRTATVAERYPDVNTIPVYLTDSNRYWSFMVTVGSPNTARTHGAWKADAGAIVTAKGPRERSRTTSFGGSPPWEKRRDEASTTLAASRPGIVFREVVRRPRETWIRFSAEAGKNPSVYYGTKPPVPSSNSGLLGVEGARAAVVRQMSVQGFAAEYSTAPLAGLGAGNDVLLRHHHRPLRQAERAVQR